MKKIILGLCAFVLTAGFCFAADPPGPPDPSEGFWLSIDDKTGKVTAGWEVYQEGGKLYGKILSLADHPPELLAFKCKESYRGFPAAGKVNQMRVVGSPWIFGLSPDKQNGQWKDGNVIDPDNGNMYSCRITFHAADGGKYKTDTLEMRGSLLGIGRSQFWQKTDRQTAGSLRPGR